VPDGRNCKNKAGFELPESLELLIPQDMNTEDLVKLKYKISLKYQLPETTEVILPKNSDIAVEEVGVPDRQFKQKRFRQYSLPDLMDILVPLSHS
jgi:hypothetical protein